MLKLVGADNCISIVDEKLNQLKRENQEELLAMNPLNFSNPRDNQWGDPQSQDNADAPNQQYGD
jgi:hypothetical protein